MPTEVTDQKLLDQLNTPSGFNAKEVSDPKVLEQLGAKKIPRSTGLFDRLRNTLSEARSGKVTPWQPSRENIRTTLETTGMLAGGVLGAGAGTVTGLPAGPGAIATGTLGAATGAGLGLAGGRQLSNLVLGEKRTPGQVLQETATALPEGATQELFGPVTGKVLSRTTKALGEKVVDPFLGTISGAGKGMVTAAKNVAEGFQEAMRGGTSGNEILDTAAKALRAIRDSRAADYISKLSNLKTINKKVDTTPITTKMNQLLIDNFRVKPELGFSGRFPPGPNLQRQMIAMGKGEKLDFSTSVFAGDKRAQGEVSRAVKLVRGWQDNTPIGLDSLKRSIDSLYSKNSEARAFIAGLRDSVKDTITKAVPQYDEMLKPYQKVTNLIKQIENTLMVGKGSTSDQILRRLTSSMRENFEMRRDMLQILSKEGDPRLAGQVAGYAASESLPKGLVGKLGAGYILSHINKAFAPVLMISSPRVVGEFMLAYGKGLRAMPGTPEFFGRLSAAKGIDYLKSKPEEVGREAKKVLSELNPVGTAEAGENPMREYGKGITRQEQLNEAMQEPKPAPAPAPAPQPRTEATPDDPEAVRAYREKLKAKEEKERMAAAEAEKKKKKRRIKAVRKSTPDGEVLVYIDMDTGQVYEENPEEK